jgi:mannose-1-phosphate guanylyltransferase
MIHAVIMAGGSGTRFWPASRNDRPKQLLNLAGTESMIQSTCRRFDGLANPAATWIVTNHRLVDAMAEQLPHLAKDRIIGEPCKRDTAPCIGLAAFLISAQDPDAIMVVSPADHVISSEGQFGAAIRQGCDLVRNSPDVLVTYGIRPTYPAESFGYIERGNPLAVANGAPAFQVKKFHEKPKSDVARRYLEHGGYYWNSGIFVWRASTILSQLTKREPEMAAHLSRIADAAGTPEFPRVMHDEFHQIKGRSIDYAVMEHAGNVAVIEAPFSWDDVGSWQAIARLRGSDQHGNTVVGKYLGIDTKNVIINSQNDHLVVTIGVKDLVVVHTPDATLIVQKDQEESVRKAVQQIETAGWTEYL